MNNKTTATAATIGGAIGVIIVAILGAVNADVSPELAAAITTLCVAICGIVFPLS